MAGYSFETISADQAAAFGTGDYLFFITNGATASQVQVSAYTSSSGVLSGSGINVTYGGKTVTFNNNLSNASAANHILFNDNSHLLIGTTGADTNLNYTATNNTNGSPNLDPYTVYALSGNDVINFGTTPAGQSNYLNGGFGSDSIVGGNGNNHIYGNSMTAAQGATQNGDVDGADTITAGTGSNYIQGNAGADVITVGTSTTAATTTTAAQTTVGFGTNRVFGGADNDTINVQGSGHNYVNGNMQNDTINDTGFGDNTLRGGQGDDVIRGGSGHSVLMGDVGNDTIIIHGRMGETPTQATAATSTAHIDVITGGDGSDTFNFSAAGAGQAALFGQVVYYQEITDFTRGVDKLILPTSPTVDGDVGHSTTVFGSVSDAEAYARTQLSGQGFGGTHLVESLSVGSANNTYLIYAEQGNTAVNNTQVANLGIIHLDGVTASAVTYTDFNPNTTTATTTGM